MKSLVVLLDATAPSFCYYEPAVSPTAAGRAVTPELFARIVGYARGRQLPLQIIACGPSGLPAALPALREVLGDHPAICYAPPSSELAARDVPIFDGDSQEVQRSIAALPAGKHEIAILRVSSTSFSSLPEVWHSLAARVYRVVLVLRGLDRFDEAALLAYEQALGELRLRLAAAFRGGRQIELNVLCDRLVLDSISGCRAGIDHLTVDWTGGLHLCPGFACDGAPPVGQLGDEPHGQPELACAPWLDLARSPLCSLCDAYQCRRCVYLSQRATLELNTPPWQMCRAAHVEREAARQLLAAMQTGGRLAGLHPIRAIDYRDPLERLIAVRDARYAGREAPREDGPPRQHRQPDKEDPVSNQAIGKVSEQERDRIRELHVRKSGLHELLAALCRLDQRTLEASPLYERLVRDMGATSLASQEWWNAMAAKYSWERKPGRSWRIDFDTCAVFVADP